MTSVPAATPQDMDDSIGAFSYDGQYDPFCYSGEVHRMLLPDELQDFAEQRTRELGDERHLFAFVSCVEWFIISNHICWAVDAKCRDQILSSATHDKQHCFSTEVS